MFKWLNHKYSSWSQENSQRRVDQILSKHGERAPQELGRLIRIIIIVFRILIIIIAVDNFLPIVLVVAIFIQLHVMPNEWHWALPIIGMRPFYKAIIGILGIWLLMRIKRPAYFAMALDTIDTSATVGPLLDALASTDYRDVAVKSLLRQLPRLTEEDADLLNGRQRAVLYRVLRHRDRALVLAALHAVQCIGDSRAIPPLERMVAHRAKTDTALAATATSSLAALRARLDRNRADALLLRPAATPTDNLVRPASSTAQPIEQLLRAAADEETYGGNMGKRLEDDTRKCEAQDSVVCANVKQEHKP